MSLCALLITLAVLSGAGASEKAIRTSLTSDEKTRIARTAWMREAKWGIALHYMREFIDRKRTMTPQEWNKLVEEFDVDALVEQVDATGAGLVLIGLSQCGGYFLAPNATYDKIMSRDEKTTWFPKRDLIRDLGTALRKRKIALMVYFPIEPPVRGDPEAVRVFRPIGQRHPVDGHRISRDEGWRHFSGQWEKVVRDFSERWGDLASGWWFDGGWFGHLSYNDAPNWDSFLAAARTGNRHSAIAINHQYSHLRGLPPPREDYFAGETGDALGVIVTSPFRDKCVQNQVLTFLGDTWGKGGKPRYNRRQVSQVADNVVQGGGVLLWDVPFNLNGTLKTSFMGALKDFNAAARNPYRNRKMLAAEDMIPKGNLAYRKRAALVSRRISKKGGHNQFNRILPPNARVHYAEGGVDGDMNTKAMASKEWSWKYFVDLLTDESFSKIKIHFGKDRYPTHYVVRVRAEGGDWQTLKEDDGGKGGTVDIQFGELKSRYIEIESVKPDGPNQKGYSMSIAELEVFGKPQ